MISIIIAAFNRADYLKIAIASVLAQTYPDWELVVWDDGSTDNSLGIAQGFKDSRIRVFSDRNSGYTKTLIRAIASSRGEYIGICDSDDWLHPDCLELCHITFNALPDVGMVFTDHYKVDATSRIIGLGSRKHFNYSPMKMLVQNVPFHFRLWQRKLYDELGGFNPEYPIAQDYEFNLRASEKTRIHHLPIPLYYYRYHPKQVSVQKRALQIEYSEKAVRDAIERRGLRDRFILNVNLEKSLFQLEPQIKEID